MYTDANGATVFCVYLLDSEGRELWSADMLQSEIMAVPRNSSIS